MKKVLLASTALIAAGVIAAPAMAAEKKAGPIALKVGGYYHGFAVNTNQDASAGAALHSTMFTQEAEISFSRSKL